MLILLCKKCFKTQKKMNLLSLLISFKGQTKRRRTKRQLLSNSVSLPMVNNDQTNNLQTMIETLIYIVHEINLEQVKLSTTINQLIKRINQNELYLNQLNINVENLYEQYHVG